ncbi:hypothetical protein EXM22_14590 [Oceanispirochaeta crateris]|uniref:DUF3322 and DUF2220 domain-containing protein n=1 Tax=Oceanispirochaeta crateris TaxID=2518645 RepID=A0A5C1QPH2_9SPIO|nr:Wadjet anti-phage system protein JetD domain-containing protein [Oceanispirochaeta crateris]QEN09149.1 hypothetical protein EXM22_14590 [Oceanispirochaeta crateris]
MSWGNAETLRIKLTKSWDSGTLLTQLYEGTLVFPCSFFIKGPTAGQITESFEAVRIWVKEWDEKETQLPGSLQKKETNNRVLGRNRIPSAWIFDTPVELLKFIGKENTYKKWADAVKNLGQTFPVWEKVALEKPHKILDNLSKLDRIIAIALWICENPKPDIYLRELSLPSVDTKFIEKNRSLLSWFLDPILPESAICAQYKGAARFEKRYGFKSKPEMIRFRFLDKAHYINGLSELAVRSDELVLFQPLVKYIFVIENDVTALAFPPVKDALLIYGRGYNFDSLQKMRCLKNKEIYYWGDLDTHGLAILSQFRSYYPQTRSFLMDSSILLSHKEHWGVEPKQYPSLPAHLSSEEAILFNNLIQDKYAVSLRLEQEFISYDILLKAIEELIP